MDEDEVLRAIERSYLSLDGTDGITTPHDWFVARKAIQKAMRAVTELCRSRQAGTERRRD